MTAMYAALSMLQADSPFLSTPREPVRVTPLKAMLASAVGFVLLVSQVFAAESYLSIKFSERHQVRTGLIWIQHKPEAVLGNRDGKRPGRGRQSAAALPQAVAEDAVQHKTPYSLVGKLLFTKPDGSISSCSAAFAGEQRVIVTAAHCVMSASGDWHGDFLFIRSFGGTRHDVYAIQCVGLPADWGSIGDAAPLAKDYAFLKTTRVSPLGHFELALTEPPLRLRVVGYSDAYFNGQKMFEIDVPVSTEGAQLTTGNNPLGHGSSGAPWIRSTNLELYSLTSRYEEGDTLTAFGPRMTSESIRLMRYVESGC